MELLSVKMEGMHSPDELTRVIMIALNNWCNGITVRFITSNELLTQAANAQTELGWLLFLEGCLAVPWVEYVSTFMTYQQCPNKWLRQLIHQLCNIMFALWDNRCKVLHKNDLSNVLHQMESIDEKILILLNKDLSLLLPSERLLFCYSDAMLMSKTPQFRREWYHKANVSYKRGMHRLHNTQQYNIERQGLQNWLGPIRYQQIISRPERTVPATPDQQPRITRWFPNH